AFPLAGWSSSRAGPGRRPRIIPVPVYALRLAVGQSAAPDGSDGLRLGDRRAGVQRAPRALRGPAGSDLRFPPRGGRCPDGDADRHGSGDAGVAGRRPDRVGRGVRDRRL
ncbi:MAG: hypothetical protein AVDCRST_MAG33-1888, partial [uncultured Thermomicrobiales bacterium]